MRAAIIGTAFLGLGIVASGLAIRGVMPTHPPQESPPTATAFQPPVVPDPDDPWAVPYYGEPWRSEFQR